MNSSAIASNPIFATIFDVKYDPTINKPNESILMNHVSTVYGLIQDNGLVIMSEISDNDDSEKIQDIISNYIRKIIRKKDADAIICEYGISKSMKLFNDFHKICLEDSCEEITEILNTDDYGLEKEIVELILKEEIGFETNWHTHTS